MSDWLIRQELPEDRAAIRDLVKRAFASMPFSEGDEQDLVDALRGDGDLVHSLVAANPAGGIIGHISFSPVTIEGEFCGWYQMAPVSVSPEVQRTGIGSALIAAGISRLTADGARGVAVVGNPVYYERFGFTEAEGLAPLADHDAPYFRVLVLAGSIPRGTLRYARAFG